MTYPFTIENNSSPNPSDVEFVQLFSCGYDSLVVKLTAIDGGFIRRRLLIETFRSDNDYDYDYDIRTWEAGTRL